MARRAANDASTQVSRAAAARKAVTWAFWSSAVLVFLVGAAWAYSTTEQTLMTDTRFLLPGPPEPGVPSEHFRIEGANHASIQRITQIFARDFGRSVYLCPIAERRRLLLSVDWVKNASVSRIWPNSLLVRITERTPVAFAQIAAADRTMMYVLVDEEGVILDPHGVASRSTLPVLTGFSAHETEKQRRERVKHFLRLQSELGEHMKEISEVDVSDPNDLRVILPVNKRALTLIVGNMDFRRRMESYLNNREEIHQRLPGARILNLTILGRITAVGDPQP